MVATDLPMEAMVDTVSATATEAMVVSATTERGRLMPRPVITVTMEERTGVMATGPGATTTARGMLVMVMVMVTVTDTRDTGAMAMAIVSTTDKSDENCQSSIEFR